MKKISIASFEAAAARQALQLIREEHGDIDERILNDIIEEEPSPKKSAKQQRREARDDWRRKWALN